MTTPTVFVSYAHEEPTHNQWVTELASNLRHNEVDASMDEWVLVPGQDTTYFMESQIRNADFVILICTPRYAEKSNIPRGGVGYEKNIISAEMLQAKDLRPKFIPVPAVPLKDFLEVLRASETGRTGWDIGWVPTKTEIAPYPFKNGIEVWLAEDGDKGPGHSDFWRAESTGRFSLFRGYQEDDADFTSLYKRDSVLQGRISQSQNKLLDFALVLWRVSEFLLYLENFAKELRVSQASASVKLYWRGLQHRQLCYHKGFAEVHQDHISLTETIESSLTISECGKIKHNLIKDVHEITKPLFESFNFFALTEDEIKSHIRKLFNPDDELTVKTIQ